MIQLYGRLRNSYALDTNIGVTVGFRQGFILRGKRGEWHEGIVALRAEAPAEVWDKPNY